MKPMATLSAALEVSLKTALKGIAAAIRVEVKMFFINSFLICRLWNSEERSEPSVDLDRVFNRFPRSIELLQPLQVFIHEVHVPKTGVHAPVTVISRDEG